MKVRFSNPDEFLTELRERGPNLPLEGILRATASFQQGSVGPVSYVTVVATYLRELICTGPEAQIMVVELRHFVGQHWPGMEDRAEGPSTRERAGVLLERLETAARELGLDYRAGIYEPAESEARRV